MFRLKNVTDKRAIIKNMNLEINEDEICCIIRAREYKDELFNAICGWENVLEGEGTLHRLQWLNVSLEQKAIQFRRVAGIASLNFPLIDSLNCRENIMIADGLDGDKPNYIQFKKYEKIFFLKDISEKKPNELNAKEYIQVLLARSFWKLKSLVIIDGLLDHLSEESREEFLYIVRGAVREMHSSVVILSSISSFN